MSPPYESGQVSDNVKPQIVAEVTLCAPSGWARSLCCSCWFCGDPHLWGKPVACTLSVYLHRGVCSAAPALLSVDSRYRPLALCCHTECPAHLALQTILVSANMGFQPCPQLQLRTSCLSPSWIPDPQDSERNENGFIKSLCCVIVCYAAILMITLDVGPRSLRFNKYIQVVPCTPKSKV